MERRNFFGICGSILGALGLSNKQEKPKTVNGLPVLEFTGRDYINNLDHLFKDLEWEKYYYAPNHDHFRKKLKVWLNKENAYSIARDCEFKHFYGPMILIAIRGWASTPGNKEYADSYKLTYCEESLVAEKYYEREDVKYIYTD